MFIFKQLSLQSWLSQFCKLKKIAFLMTCQQHYLRVSWTLFTLLKIWNVFLSPFFPFISLFSDAIAILGSVKTYLFFLTWTWVQPQIMSVMILRYPFLGQPEICPTSKGRTYFPMPNKSSQSKWADMISKWWLFYQCIHKLELYRLYFFRSSLEI